MRAIARALVSSVAVGLVASLAGCPNMGSTGAGSRDAAPVTSEPVNSNDVTRYPYEKKLKDVSATLLKEGIARKSPPDGPPITTLPKGTVVSQIGQTSDSFLVTFDDPSSGAKKMGWIVENAFSDAPAPVARAGGGGGGAAGGSSSGGHGSGSSSTSSSGGGITPPTPGGGTIFTQPVNGQCPSGFVKSNVGCHRTCGADGDCPSGVKCKSGVIGSTKICTTG